MTQKQGSAATPLRILMIAPQPFYQERGTPIAVGATASTLARLGHHVHILTLHEGREWIAEGCEVERIPALRIVRGIRPGFSFKKLICDVLLVRSCWRRVRRERFDLLHGVEEGGFIAWVVGRLRHIPFVYDMDSSMSLQLVSRWSWLRFARPLMVAVERRMMRASEGVIAACEALDEVARTLAPEVVHEALEDQSLLKGDTQYAPANDVPDTWTTVAMYVGNLERYQGIELLLEGLALARRTDPGIGLIVVGGIPKHVRSYREYAEHVGCAGGVAFLGPRPTDQLGAYLHRADILVSPRRTGVNTPMKIYSYMDSGTAILATDIRSHRQALNDRVARLVEPTPSAVADGLLRLAEDPELRSALGRAAHDTYLDRFGPRPFEEKLRRFYGAVGQRTVSAFGRIS